MMATATARRIGSRSFHLIALLLLLAGCSSLSKNIVVIRENVDSRLVTRVKDGLFLTTVRIGDLEAGPFLIDTGADSLLLDSGLAKVVPLSFLGEADSPDVKQKVKLGTLGSLEVGPLTLQNINIAVLDLSAPTPILGEKLAGILGHPFFAQVIVEIDYLAGSVACFDPKSYRLPRGQWQPLTFQAGRPIMTARLEGDIEGRFMLDTGATSTVLLSAEFLRTHASLGNRPLGNRKHISLGGTFETLVAEIEWFELAGHRFEKPLVQFVPPDKPEFEPEGVAGVIGEGFLRQFTVVLNYPAGKIAFLPR